MRTLIRGMAGVGAVILLFLGPRDPLKQCFGTIVYMAECLSQRHSWIQNLFLSLVFQLIILQLTFCRSFFSLIS